MNSPIPGEAKPAGRVLNIQHFCTHDGPGIRTTVFLKGCSLRCKWCCNPESIHPKSELAFDFKKCIGEKECGWCLKACPENAINFVDTDGTVRINWDLCTNCGKCVPVCPPEALYEFGRDMTVAELLAGIPVYRHIGLYVYRREFLLRYTRLPQTPLERVEKLEQLRILEHGYPIRVAVTTHHSIAVDTPADLERARALAGSPL
jgi:ferredoxin